MRGEIIAVVAVVAILIGAGAGYLVGNANERTVTSVSTTTTTISEPAPRFSYITTASACQSNFQYVPCLGFPAHVFNSCPLNIGVPPVPPHTCKYILSTPSPPQQSYSVNITIGVVGLSGEPDWANCQVTGGIGYADCISVINSTAFIVGVGAPPPQ